MSKILSATTELFEYSIKAQPNPTAILVPIRDSNAISDKLHLLSDDNYLLNKYALNAIQASKGNTWSDYVDKLDLIVDEAMKLKN